MDFAEIDVDNASRRFSQCVWSFPVVHAEPLQVDFVMEVVPKVL